MGYGEDDRGFASTLQLTTGRLVLRPIAAGDRAQMAKLSANPAIAQNLIAIPSPHAGECGESFVVASRIGEIVGSAAYGPMADRRSLVEVAVWIAEPFWGQGYATEATQAVIDRAFADERVNVLWCTNRVTNTRARRVVEKCGFQFRETGMVRSPTLLGAFPVERFVLDRKNWTSLKAWGAHGQRKEWPDAPRDNAA